LIVENIPPVTLGVVLLLKSDHVRLNGSAQLTVEPELFKFKFDVTPVLIVSKLVTSTTSAISLQEKHDEVQRYDPPQNASHQRTHFKANQKSLVFIITVALFVGRLFDVGSQKSFHIGEVFFF